MAYRRAVFNVFKPGAFSHSIRSMSTVQLKDPELFKQAAFINNEWVSSSSADYNQKFEVVDPASQEMFGSLPDMNVTDVKLAIKAAYTAFSDSEWTASSVKHRHDVLMNIHRLMIQHQHDLATILCLENGKPFKESLGELTYAAGFVEWFAEECYRSYGDIIPSPSSSTRYITIKQPIGVAGIITPWNFPIAMITRKVAAAIAAGCSTVIKPASETPFSALAFAELAYRAGLPPGVINVVTTKSYTKEIGHELCLSPQVMKISFTGSTNVGKLLMKDCSDNVKRLSLELGGNAPFIVFDDADVDAAVEGAISSKFRNAGQTCVCPNRFHIHEGIYEEFSRKLSQKVSQLKLGHGLRDHEVQIGPLIDSKALEKVQLHVQDAVSKGAILLTGGKAAKMENQQLKGAFYEPTVLTNMTTDMRIHQEETFGPVAPLFPFQTEDEVVHYANDTVFGLAGYVYTRGTKRAWLMAEKLNVGMVAVNSPSVSTNSAPFGGVKQSGYGREGSKYGMNEYQNIKFIALGIN